jgi:site-specific DNA-methyltransferase (adenine-specific)
MNERDTNFQEPTNPALNIASVSNCPFSIVFNEDCVQGLKRFDDNYFDLAIVDPPYGINVHNNYGVGNRNDKKRDAKNWDNKIPTTEYFIELERVSKEQIIWGANYFNCFNGSRGAIIWNKLQPLPDSSQCEIASYSRLRKVGLYEQRWTNFVNTKGSEHPTEKPVELYRWLLKNYGGKINPSECNQCGGERWVVDDDFTGEKIPCETCQRNPKILDTHGGSMSIAIACDKEGFDLVCCEIDTDYYKAAVKRFEDYKKQLTLF